MKLGIIKILSLRACDEMMTSGKSNDDDTNTIQTIRRQFRSLTNSIVNMSHGGGQDGSSKKHREPGADPGPPAVKNEWDEICLGIWQQDRIARQTEQGGKCHGISVIKSDRTDGKIQHMRPTRAYLHIVLLSKPAPPSSSDGKKNKSGPKLSENSSNISKTDQGRSSSPSELLQRIVEKQKQLSAKLVEPDRYEKTVTMIVRMKDKSVQNANLLHDRLSQRWREWFGKR